MNELIIFATGLFSGIGICLAIDNLNPKSGGRLFPPALPALPALPPPPITPTYPCGSYWDQPDKENE